MTIIRDGINTPFLQINVTKIIGEKVENCVILPETPDKFSHVQVNGYSESASLLPASNNYYVDYQQGFIVFASSENGKSVDISFKGKGTNFLYEASVLDSSQFLAKATYDPNNDGVVEKSNKVGDKTLADLDGRYPSVSAFNSHLSDYATLLINAKYPPAPLTSAKGDGVTNDTSAIQAIIDYCASYGYRLYIPNGTYLISTSIDSKGITVIGQSVEGVIIKAIAGVTNMLVLPTTLTVENVTFDGNGIAYKVIPYGTNCDSIQLKNFKAKNCAATFNGSYPTTSALEVNAISVILDNVEATNNKGHGCDIQCSHSGAIYAIRGKCNFSNNGDPGTQAIGLVNRNRNTGVNFKHLILHNVEAEGNTASGIATHSSNNVVIGFCNSHNNGEHGFCLMDGKNAILFGNKASGNTVAALRIQGDLNQAVEDSIVGWDNADISGNIFDGNSIGISYIYKVRNILVTGNRITNCTTYTQYIANMAGHTNCSNIVSRGNVLHSLAVVKRPHAPRTGYILDDTIVFDDYDLNGNKIDYWVMYSGTNPFASTAKLLQGDRTSIITSPTDYTNVAWVKQGTVNAGVITASGAAAYMYQRLNYAQQRYFSMVLFFDTANTTEAQLAINARLRRSDASLIADLGYRYIATLGNKLALVWDLTQDTTIQNLTDAAYIDFWLTGTAGAAIKPTGIYACFSSELPIVPNHI